MEWFLHDRHLHERVNCDNHCVNLYFCWSNILNVLVVQRDVDLQILVSKLSLVFITQLVNFWETIRHWSDGVSFFISFCSSCFFILGYYQQVYYNNLFWKAPAIQQTTFTYEIVKKIAVFQRNSSKTSFLFFQCSVQPKNLLIFEVI